MGRLLNLVTPLHRATKRDYVARMMDEKVHCMLKAKEYEQDYWDGDRRYGYGGYRYIEGRWTPVAKALIESYGNELELFNLECWALTAESFFDTAEWIWLYSHFGYTGDYEFIYFE